MLRLRRLAVSRLTASLMPPPKIKNKKCKQNPAAINSGVDIISKKVYYYKEYQSYAV